MICARKTSGSYSMNASYRLFGIEGKMIEICNITKTYHGSKRKILDDLNLLIEDGQIVSLIGKNGAGKSTLIRVIAGIISADSGCVRKRREDSIGVMLGGDMRLYQRLTGYEIVSFFGRLRGLEQIIIDKRIEELDEVLHLTDFYKTPVYTYSRGMRQKIGLLISIIHDPDIVLMDEPSTGLDLEATNDVIEFIKFLKARNRTILIATHNIFEISDLIDFIAPLNDGKIQKLVDTHKLFEKCNTNEKVKKILQLL